MRILPARLVDFGTRGSQVGRAKPTVVDGIQFASKAEASKYKNRPTMVDGVRYASKKEANRHAELKLLERAGSARNIRRQVQYAIAIHGQHICTYRADYVYEERLKGGWVEFVEDVKGYKTPEYRLKKRLMKVVLGITLRET